MFKEVKKNIAPFIRKLFKEFIDDDDFSFHLNEEYKYSNGNLNFSEIQIKVGDVYDDTSTIFRLESGEYSSYITFLGGDTSKVTFDDDVNIDELVVLIKKYLEGIKKEFEIHIYLSEIAKNIKEYQDTNGINNTVKSILREQNIDQLV